MAPQNCLKTGYSILRYFKFTFHVKYTFQPYMVLGEPSHQKNASHNPEEAGPTTASCSPEQNTLAQRKEGHAPEWSYLSKFNFSVALCSRCSGPGPVKSSYSVYSLLSSRAHWYNGALRLGQMRARVTVFRSRKHLKSSAGGLKIHNKVIKLTSSPLPQTYRITVKKRMY